MRQPSATASLFPAATPKKSPSGSKSDEPTILPSEFESYKSLPSRSPIEPPLDQPSFAPFRPSSTSLLPFPTATPTISPIGSILDEPRIVRSRQLSEAPSSH